MRRIYKGSTITHSMNLPVNNIEQLEYLSILLHTHSDNDITKTYPTSVAYANDEFSFTITSQDIATLREGILWATVDFRENGVDYNKKIQLPYYIKYREGAISSTIVTISEVEAVVEACMDSSVESLIDEKYGDLLETVESNTAAIESATEGVADNSSRLDDLEAIDHSQYLTQHQSLKTINGQSIVGTGNITIEGGADKTSFVLHWTETGDEKYITSPYSDYLAIKEHVAANGADSVNVYLVGDNGAYVLMTGVMYTDGILGVYGTDGTAFFDIWDEDDTLLYSITPIADAGPEYDDTAIKNRLDALEAIDHTNYLTEVTAEDVKCNICSDMFDISDVDEGLNRMVDAIENLNSDKEDKKRVYWIHYNDDGLVTNYDQFAAMRSYVDLNGYDSVRIYFVDDSNGNHFLVTEMLATEDYFEVTATDGYTRINLHTDSDEDENPTLSFNKEDIGADGISIDDYLELKNRYNALKSQLDALEQSSILPYYRLTVNVDPSDATLEINTN